MQALAKLEVLRSEFAHAAEEAHRADANAQNPTPVPAPMAPPARDARRNLVRVVRAGLTVMIGFFGFIGVWAAVSPIDSAAIAFGVIGAEGSRKGVQHLDGGVIGAILVKEGEVVQAGQELIRLDEVQPRAALEINAGAVRTLKAVIARLEAESAGLPISFPASLREQAQDLSVQTLLASQEQLYAARKTARETQVSTLVEQIKQARAQVEIFRGQASVAEDQHRLVNEELAPKEMRFEKGYAPNPPVMQLKRAAAALLGQKQEATGNIARLEYTISQLQSQISQTNSDFLVRVAAELEDARSKLADAMERERVSRDILQRTVIRAPVSGRVLGLAVNTVGGVVAKGDRLLEIVPEDAGILVKARFRPMDGIEIQEGMRAELRLLSAQGRKLPLIYGTVRTRSADSRQNPQTGEAYFEVDVTFSADDLRDVDGGRIALGTPVEIIVPTGSRTVLEYMIEPISESLRHGMREK